LTGNICPAGHYCETGSSYPTPCPIGTYLASTGNTNSGACIACRDGLVCNTLGATAEYVQCDEGYYCPSATLKVACPAGSFCIKGVSIHTACGAGTYQPHTHASSCLTCPEGYYCDGTTPTTAKACPEGKYCLAGTSTPENCAAGTYNPFTTRGASDECTECIEGMYCDTNGMTAIDTNKKCLKNYFCSGGNSAGNTQRCPAGSYCPE
jgi:hypothetical protein